VKSTNLPVRQVGRFAAGLGSVLLFAAACGSNTTNTASTNSTPTSAPTTAAPSAADPTSAAAAGLTVSTADGPLGTYLVDKNGISLYDFEIDTPTESKCVQASCVSFWPILTITSGAPVAAGKVQAGLLSTISRADGTKQVTYNGHPLYYFKNDKAAGDIKGQKVNAFGGDWYLLDAGGKQIEAKAPGAGAAGKSPSPASGGGWS